MTRTPYADRPAVRAEFCTCAQDDSGERERWFTEHTDDNGNVWRAWHYVTDPKCKLHGENAKEAPF